MAPVLGMFVALFFAGMGLLGIFQPHSLVGQFGIKLERPEARAEVRAVYGGYGCAIGILLFLSNIEYFDPNVTRGIRLAMIVSLQGMASGRLIAAIMESKSFTLFPTVFYFVVEVSLATMLYFA